MNSRTTLARILQAEAVARESKRAEEWERTRQQQEKEAVDAANLRTEMAVETRNAVATLTAVARNERAGFETLVHSKDQEAR